MQHLQTNTTLQGGKYRIERELGQGSFGITYLAMHTVLERKVCIKEFFMKEINTRNADGSITGMTDGSLSYNYGQKFKKEALNLSCLDHPNIVRVTDSFEENGTYYYVMDYIDGDNLNDYLKGHEVTQKEALDIIRDVATALMYMHEEKKMLHLDLKPGNIMRRHGDGHIFLIDFGLSKHYCSDGQPETSTSIGLGTAGYAPIEQANQMKSGEFRPTIDVYALGATLFKLLTRETPPQASEMVSDDELIESKLRANGFTGPIIGVVVNAMLLNARKRTQSVKEFLDALSEEELADEPKEDSKSQKPTLVIKEEETEILGSQEFFEESNWYIPEKYVNNPAVTAEKANNGETDAMFAYGMMLLRGQGVVQSMDTARPYFMKAQAKGDARAQKVIDDWEILKKKYERKRTKTNVSVVENASLSWFASIVGAGIIGLFIWFFSARGCKNHTEQVVDKDIIDTVYIDTVATNFEGKQKIIKLIEELEKNMVLVDGGTFKFGLIKQEDNTGRYGIPTGFTKKTVNSFYICKYETIQDTWECIMGYNRSKYKGKNKPITNISWDECMTFIKKLNALSGRRFRLPTVIEWEFAAIGGNKSKSYTYSGSNNADDVACRNKLENVGSKQPNELGLYDMSGNACEWCSDDSGFRTGNSIEREIRGGGVLVRGF